MAKKKIVINPKPFRMESGPNIGIALQIMYDMVAPEDAGYDLFDEHQLERLKEDFVKVNESRFAFSYEPGPINSYTRVFAEFKGK